MSLVRPFDRLLVKSEPTERKKSGEPNKDKHTFQASSKSIGRITYRFLRTAVGMLSGGLGGLRHKVYLGVLRPELPKQFPLMIVGPVVRRLEVVPGQFRTLGWWGSSSQSSRSTSGPRFIFAVHVWKIRRRSLLDGSGNSIFRSNRPGRNRAGSRVSARFVAMMTYIAWNHETLMTVHERFKLP